MSARDELLDFALAAFRDCPNPVVTAHAEKLVDAFRAEVLREAADAVDGLRCFERQFSPSLSAAQVSENIGKLAASAELRRMADEAAQPCREVWDGSLPPGGLVCSICGQPVESEPCPEHSTPPADACPVHSLQPAPDTCTCGHAAAADDHPGGAA